MDGSKDVTSLGAEWAKAMLLLREVLAPQLLAEWQPTAPQAVYSTWVTVWLLVFQRLNQNASLVAAVAAFLDRKIRFDEIHGVNLETLDAVVTTAPESLEDLLALDAVARAAADHAVLRRVN